MMVMKMKVNMMMMIIIDDELIWFQYDSDV